MAATTVALSVAAVSNARFHAALTEEFESANAGSWNVERINGLIYATVMETRGIYMSADAADAADAGKYADSLLKATDQISAVTGDWQRSVRNSDALAFSNLAVRLNDYLCTSLHRSPSSRGPRPRANGPPKTSRPAALPRVDWFSRVLKARACFYLYEHQQPTPARDDVNFADRAAPATRQDTEALGDEESGGAAFSRNSDPECSLPFRPRDALQW